MYAIRNLLKIRKILQIISQVSLPFCFNEFRERHRTHIYVLNPANRNSIILRIQDKLQQQPCPNNMQLWHPLKKYLQLIISLG